MFGSSVIPIENNSFFRFDWEHHVPTILARYRCIFSYQKRLSMSIATPDRKLYLFCNIEKLLEIIPNHAIKKNAIVQKFYFARIAHLRQNTNLV